jgi:hypothetical protein
MSLLLALRVIPLWRGNSIAFWAEADIGLRFMITRPRSPRGNPKRQGLLSSYLYSLNATNV